MLEVVQCFTTWIWGPVGFKEQTQSEVHLLEFDAGCRCFSQMFSVCSPGEESHHDHHERQSRAEHNAADGQLDRTIRSSRRPQIWGSGGVLEQKDRREVLKHRDSVFGGAHLAPPSPVVVLCLEFRDQSDVAARLLSDFIPVGVFYEHKLKYV